ncbi:hypothetical protein [Kitasatospora herbaricolor]|uniref:Uncharacterized protein n=1 Tax=Kitasatospora herbaricolor TaxID=68217 RepID=A0ABZ1WK38_9ACTN|nr:hypothetical protein [Kitasatospora herbaricolor]
MTSEASENRTGYTPEEMDLPADLVERIGQVCQLLGLPLAARSGEPGVALNRDGAWVPGTAADHVLVSWRVSDRLLDACEQAMTRGRPRNCTT